MGLNPDSGANPLLEASKPPSSPGVTFLCSHDPVRDARSVPTAVPGVGAAVTRSEEPPPRQTGSLDWDGGKGEGSLEEAALILQIRKR